MTPPVIFIEPNKDTPTGVLCTITYNGQTRQHSQRWQAIVFYRQMYEMYEHDVAMKSAE
jgi:hypothetical protein